MDETSSVYDLKRTLTALACVCTYPRIEYLIADPGAYQEEKERYYRALRREQVANIFCSYGTQFLPDLANDACKAAKGEVLLFLTAGMQPTGGCDIKKLAGYCLQPHIGLTGGSVNKIITPYTKNATIVNAPAMVQKSKLEAARGFDATFHQRGYIQALSLTMLEQGLYNVIVPEAFFCHNPQKYGAKPKPDSVNRLRIRDRFGYLKD
jgi:hypothetical protein